MSSLLKIAILQSMLVCAIHANRWSVGPAEGWVVPVEPARPSAEVAEGGYRSLLSDDQILVEPTRQAHFYRRVYRLESVEGTRSFDGLSIDFDPSWQKSTLHWIRVRRDDKTIDKLDPRKVRFLQREENLESGQIDDRRTLHIVLEDLRAGDELDYAWSIDGVHPAFPGISSGSFVFEAPWFVERRHFRMVWGRADSLRTLLLNGVTNPVVDRSGGRKILTWDLRGVAASKFDEQVPGWWDERPVMDWTNLADWKQLARAQSRFYEGASNDPEVESLARRIALVDATPASQVVAVLRYLQDSIRYLGYEGGMGSHVPRRPKTTLGLRQGDCKDKSVLMTGLLRSLGIEAHPVLVNTQGDKNMGERLPSPWWFDHVVVGVRLSGRLYLLDPTDVDQRGRLEDIPQVRATRVLILEPNSEGLQEIPAGRVVQPEYDLKENWDASKGPGFPARLERFLVRNGRAAEAFRNRLSRSSPKTEIDADFERVKSIYPGLRRDGAPTWMEDSITGAITWRSFFLCDSFWKNMGDSTWKLSVSAGVIKDLAQDPGDLEDRRAPLDIGSFHNCRVKIKVRLPDRDWASETNEYEPEVPSLDFKFRSDLHPSVFELQWDWATLSDHVALEDLPSWKAVMDSVRTKSEWTITLDRRNWVSKFNWSVAFLCVAIFGIGLWGARKLWSWSPKRLPTVSPNAIAQRSPWWGLYALGLIVNPVRAVYEFGQTLWIFDAPRWSDLVIENGSLSALVLAEVGFQILTIPMWVLLQALFWRKRSSFPVLNAAIVGSIVAWVALDALLIRSLGGIEGGSDLHTIAVNLVSLSIWILYFLTSNRSKAVFRVPGQGVLPEVPLAPIRDVEDMEIRPTEDPASATEETRLPGT
ncbi:MAG: inner membrane protein YdgK [Fibrobacterota bacterium]|jgi:hypothetical protein